MNHVSKQVWFEVYDFYHSQEADLRDELLVLVEDFNQADVFAVLDQESDYENDYLFETETLNREIAEYESSEDFLDEDFDSHYLQNLKVEQELAETTMALNSSNLLTFLRAVA